MADCYGTFELQILEIENIRGELTGGECCGGTPRIRVSVGDRSDNQSACMTSCRTFFKVCLKEYQSNMSAVSGSCSYGNASSPVLGGNSFTLADPDRANGKLIIRFKFSWTRAFTLLLEALDLNNYTLPGNSKLIEKATYSGIILPSAEWHTLNHHGLTAKITYRIRVQCDKHYFSPTCMKFCRPRDDKFGHFTCDPNGNKECIAGWKGANCEIAVCKIGCHPEHGKCDYPGACECRPGWRGEFCNQCQPYPGCKHGYCNLPYECICDTNWGGILCERDLNYCGTHEPCLHGGTCSNTAPDRYFCTCPEGFSGSKCEIVVNPCVTAPCANGGTCMETQGHFMCICPGGWTGNTCSINIDECTSSPCLNGGTCVDEINSFECLCPPNWEGDHCQYDTNECETSKPCMNAISCQNVYGDYQCECQKGWTGKNCDQNINDCLGQCQHDATCIDLVSDYYCACAPGYTGRDCQTDIDECEVNQCKNGGECVDLVNGFRCICPVGFAGEFCQIDHDHCNPNPCQNGAQCLNMPEDYYCHCSENWQGKNCSIPKLQCIAPPCDSGVENCLIVPVSSTNETFYSPGWGICGDNGHCVQLTDGDFRCVCDPGYTGKFCSENINECKMQPCLNGGTCIDKINAYFCVCAEGWEGETCFKNKNECESNPCKNNGTCIDGLADFTCICREGWKGKTCTLRNSHCDRYTCNNGGTCLDRGDTFHCECPPHWEGTTCHIAKSQACTSSPCLNGGTCVNKGNYFTCICMDEFEGERCQFSANNYCNPSPCFNGGKCINGKNWFQCECLPGFTGPDCRLNVDECASNPCAQGATCIDGDARYECLCPPGRRGTKCDQSADAIVSVEGGSSYLKDGGLCYWQGQYFANNSNWQQRCNTCSCLDGQIRCTSLWCGFTNCLFSGCENPNQVCMALPRENCLSPPCLEWGECRDLISGNKDGVSVLPALLSCRPNQAVLSDFCTRLSLYVNVSKLRPAVTTEDLCYEIRKLISLHEVSRSTQFEIIALCELKQGYNDTVEITLSCKKDSFECSEVLKEHIKFIGEVVGRKQVASQSILDAVVEIKLETVLSAESKQISYIGTYFSPIYLSVALLIALTILTLVCRYRCSRAKGDLSTRSRSRETRNFDEEKSNNLQNEETFRRFANPLKENAVVSNSDVSSTVTVVDLPVKINVVRPISHTSEMMEMMMGDGISAGTDAGKGVCTKALLSKTQNSAFQKTAAVNDCSVSSAVICQSKDGCTKPLNINVIHPIQRPSTTPSLQPQSNDDCTSSNAFTTVLV